MTINYIFDILFNVKYKIIGYIVQVSHILLSISKKLIFAEISMFL